MPVSDLSLEQFEAFIETNPIAFIDFWANWCAPCKQFETIFAKVAANNPHIQFAKVNIETESQLAEIFHIRSIPHLIVFKEGIAIYSEAGTIPLSTLEELVKQASTVDVSDIRAKLDES